MQNKINYDEARLEILELEVSDIVTSSGNIPTDDPDYSNESWTPT